MDCQRGAEYLNDAGLCPGCADHAASHCAVCEAELTEAEVTASDDPSRPLCAEHLLAEDPEGTAWVDARITTDREVLEVEGEVLWAGMLPTPPALPREIFDLTLDHESGCWAYAAVQATAGYFEQDDYHGPDGITARPVAR